MSRRQESCTSELISFISPLILRASFVTTDLDILGEFTTLDAREEKKFLAIRPTHFLREGVLILIVFVPLLYGINTYKNTGGSY